MIFKLKIQTRNSGKWNDNIVYFQDKSHVDIASHARPKRIEREKITPDPSDLENIKFFIIVKTV